MIKNKEPEIKNLSDLQINLNSVRVAILNQMKNGTKEMDLESFLFLVHEVYRKDKNG